MTKTTGSIFETTEITLNGVVYDCAMEIDIECLQYWENHGGYREPQSETTYEFDFEATDKGGHSVMEKALKRSIRAALHDYIEDNLERLARRAL